MLRSHDQVDKTTTSPKRQGICTKCDEKRTIANKKGECQGCGYGANRGLTREQVITKKREKNTIPPVTLIGPVATPFADRIPKAPEPASTEPFVKSGKETETATCFFCKTEGERPNTAGEIKFNDGNCDRKIHVCHDCASKSLQNQLNRAYVEARMVIIGELLYRQAMDAGA